MLSVKNNQPFVRIWVTKNPQFFECESSKGRDIMFISLHALPTATLMRYSKLPVFYMIKSRDLMGLAYTTRSLG